MLLSLLAGLLAGVVLAMKNERSQLGANDLIAKRYHLKDHFIPYRTVECVESDASLLDLEGYFCVMGTFFVTHWDLTKYPHPFRFNGGTSIQGRGIAFANYGFILFGLREAEHQTLADFDYVFFENRGDMWFSFGGLAKVRPGSTPSDSRSADLHIRAANFNNKGRLVISSWSSWMRAHFETGSTLEPKKPFENSGTLCLQNAQLSIQADVAGSGCIYVQADAVLNLKDGAISDGQVIFLDPQAGTASVFFTEALMELLRVMGFGKKTFLLFEASILAWSYTKGIL